MMAEAGTLQQMNFKENYRPHPLMLKPVLEVLFDKCNFETLKILRQVCKQWECLSTHAFRKKSLVNFYSMYPETYVDLMNSIEDGYNFVPLNVALTLSPLHGEPYASHSLDYFNRNLTVCPWHACEECIFPHGENIESLKFYAWDSVSDKLNASVLNQILLTPKRLQSLEISLLPSAISLQPLFPYPWEIRPPLDCLKTLIMYGKVECSEKFLYNFLSAMPNVNSITVNCCSPEFLDVFCAALYEVPVRRLQHLKLNFVGSFTDTQLKNIQKAQLPLRTLHTAPRSWVTNFEEYKRLLVQVAPTLQDAKLTICTSVTDFEQFIAIPSLPKLKSLKLQSWRGGIGYWNLSFINNVPNLETLILERRGLFAPIQNLDEGLRCFIDEKGVTTQENLKNLVLPSMPLLFPHTACLTSLLTKFPNLIKLTLSANDECLECVFQCVPRLEELTIAEYSKITDDGMTGLTSGRVAENEEQQVSCNLRQGITALKGLRRLEVDGFWGNITDFSVSHGIRHMPKLETVIFRGCKISDWGRKILCKMQLTVIGHDSLHIFEPEPLDDFFV